MTSLRNSLGCASLRSCSQSALRPLISFLLGFVRRKSYRPCHSESIPAANTGTSRVTVRVSPPHGANRTSPPSPSAVQQAAAAPSKEILPIRVEPRHHLCIILSVLLVMRWTASVGTQCDMYMSACQMTLVERRINAELFQFHPDVS